MSVSDSLPKTIRLLTFPVALAASLTHIIELLITAVTIQVRFSGTLI